ncbi:MAG: putative porin [Candidatus Omnitrophica bacterium]|nr:putative porin [Candidatus Omnitrophota bacterium]
MRKHPITKALGGFAVFLMLLNPTVHADEAKLISMVEKLEKQMSSMQRTIDDQNKKIRTLESRGGAEKSGSEEGMKIDHADFDNNLKESLGDASKWLKGLNFKGDYRLRYEGQSESGKSQNSTNDRNRFRYRLRFGFEKTFSEEFKVGWRLASGDLAGITSTNQTFDSNFGYKSIVTDLAYATYVPNWAKVGIINQLEITGGKFANPFTEGSSMMIWDGDVTPEGIYEKIQLKLLKTEGVDVDLSFLAGQMVLEEGSGSDHDDAELFAYQGGFETTMYVPGMSNPVEMKNLASFYDYMDFNLPGNFAATNGNFTGTGNQSTRLASAFAVFEIYNELSFQAGPLPKSTIFFDWAKNVAENANDAQGGGYNTSWGLGYKLGKAKKKGTWQLSYEYYNIEANAVPGVFADSDFGHADRRGSVFKGAYALTDNLQLGAAAFFTRPISSEHDLTVDTKRSLFQVDLVWKI